MLKSLIGLFYLTVVVSGKATRHVWQESIFNVPNFKTICEHYKDVMNLNATCAEQLNIVCKNYSLFLTVLDASSSFPYTGLGYASKSDLGNFDQCLQLHHPYENGTILGEYCLEGFIMPDKFENMSDANTYYIVSVCRPNGCNSDAYNAIIHYLIDPRLPAIFMDDRCQTIETGRHFSTVDIVTLVMFGAIIWLMLISTIYDFYYVHKKQYRAYPLLVAFSVISNGKKLFHLSKTTTSKEQIEVINGLRVISMMWVLAGHGFIAWDFATIINRGLWENNWSDQFYSGYIMTAPLSVDTFFFISGCLIAFQYLKYKDKPVKKHILNVPNLYLHRYIRLTIPLLMAYMVVVSFFEFMGNGPMWDRTIYYSEFCKTKWWAFFLYIQNYYNYDDVCMVQTWFLSAVMQMFFLSPMVLIPLSYILTKPVGFKMSVFLLMILNVMCTVIPLVHRLIVTNYDNVYDTHSRLIDYSIGMTLGMFMREKINEPFLYMAKQHHRSIINYVVWTITLITMVIIVLSFQLVEMHDDNQIRVIFQSIMRPIWCTGLSWIIYSCYHGYGGIINWVLCIPIFRFLGKLTYSMYLLHQSVIDFKIRTTRVPWDFSNYNAFYLYCGHYIVSMGLAIVWVLAFESPIIVLEKYFTRKEKPIVEQKTIEQQKHNNDDNHQNTGTQNSNNIIAQNLDSTELYKKSNEA